MLKSLDLHGVGPVPELSATFGERLNIITGDNGLGKSFLLDVCFWCLTAAWPGGRVAIPNGSFKKPSVKYEIKSKTKSTLRKADYDLTTQSWSRQRGQPPMPGLVIYAAVDGSFAVWDPARNYWRDSKKSKSADEWPRAFQFPPSYAAHESGEGPKSLRRDVANGLEEGGRVLCNGLIADWNEWFYERQSEFVDHPFSYLESVVSTLSHPSEPLGCEQPRKVFLDDSRRFPVLRTPYAYVPYPQWSAGVKRIISLAYLIVWAWVEHLEAAKLRGEEPTESMILLIDEIEAHLHPKWQRTILPAILKVVDELKKNLSVQIFAATHSPLVLASVEPYFEEEKDQLFLFTIGPEVQTVADNLKDINSEEERLATPMLRLAEPNQQVNFDALPWAAHGDVVGWLTSDIFGLDQARSREAEEAIEQAEAFMRGEVADLPPDRSTKEAITERLRFLLPSFDPFWPRWIVGAKP